MLLILKLMVVFDVLPINYSISFGAVALNDFTHPKKGPCLCLHSLYVFPDQ